MWKDSRCHFPIDILLLVMKSEKIVWYLGPHPIVNTTCVEATLWKREENRSIMASEKSAIPISYFVCSHIEIVK